eukprot:99677_1
MCWSWEVSLSFVIFQLISFVYLWRRNKYVDRWYVMVCAPFMGQEVTQFFQWVFGDIENATNHECNVMNLTWAKILIVVAYSIPLVVAIFAYATSQYTKETNPILSMLWKCLLILDVIMFPILTIFMLIDRECVTVGENGHQHWPPLLDPQMWNDTIGEAGTMAIISIYYYPSIVLVGIFYQPLWIALFPALYSIVSIVILFITIGSEAWSVWCWSCAIITVWVFLYVPMSHWMIKIYENEDHEESSVDTVFGDNCVCRCLFRKTHEHMVRFRMLNARAGAGLSSEQEMLSMNINDDL